MLKRLMAAFVIATLALTFAIGTPDAQANTDCDPVPEPFAIVGGETISASQRAAQLNLTFQQSIDLIMQNNEMSQFAMDSVKFFQFKFSGRCNGPVAYPGPFEVMPTTPSGPYGWYSLNPVAAAPAAAAAPASVAASTGAGLAHTGSEASVLAFIGTGLVGFGALAQGARRRLR